MEDNNTNILEIWSQLPLMERSKIMASYYLNGVFNRDLIMTDYINRASLDLILDLNRLSTIDYVNNRFPASRALLWNYYKDDAFNPRRDLGDKYGNIEYMRAEHDTLPYYNDYPKPELYRGTSTIVYNSDIEDPNEALALDLITHGLREQDPYWNEKILPELLKVWDSSDPGWWAKKQYANDYNLRGEEAEPLEHYMANEIDAAIRSMLVNPSSPEAESYDLESNAYLVDSPEKQKAWLKAYDYIMNYDGHLLPQAPTLDNVAPQPNLPLRTGRPSLRNRVKE